MKKIANLLLILFITVSCTLIASENSAEPVIENPAKKEIIMDQNESQLNISIKAESTTLCTGCKTILKAEAAGYEVEGVEYSWSVELGSIEGIGSEVFYSAPQSISDSHVDYVSLKVTDGEKEIEEKLPILLIGDEEMNLWVPTNGPYGGNIKEIEISSKDPNILYTAGGGGKVYKSINGGNQWISLGQVGGDEFINQLVLSESDGESNILVVQDEQLFLSNDDGESWTRKTELGNVLELEKSTYFPNKVIAGGAGNQIYLSDDYGNSWSRIGGFNPTGAVVGLAFGQENEYWAATTIWRSEIDQESILYHTMDRGKNWEQVDFPLLEETVFHSIFVDGQNPDHIYIGLNDLFNRNFVERDSKEHVFLSKDHGDTWETFGLPFADAMVTILGKPSGSEKLYIASGGHVFVKDRNAVNEFGNLIEKRQIGDPADIAFHPENPDIIYLPVHQGDGIRKSIDGGESWKTINDGLDNTSIALLSTVPSTDTADGATFVTSSVGGEGVFISRDFGENWNNVIENGVDHPWLDEIQISPAGIEEIWLVADVGKVYVSKDGGENFETQISTDEEQGFKYGSIYAIESHDQNNSILYALKNGFGIYKSDDGGKDWTFLEDSEVDYTFALALHPEDPDIVFSGYSPKPFQDFGMIRKSEDGGESWTTPLRLENSDGITSIAIDLRNPDRMYVGNVGDIGEIWTSENGGDNWFQLNPNLNFTNLHAIETYQGSPDIVYGGVWGGGTHYSVDAGKTWQQLENDPTVSASAILLNPNDPNEIYISDRALPKVFHTTNAGEDWVTIFDGGSEYYRVLSSAISASNPDVIYISVFGYQGPFSGDVFRIENGNQEKVTGDLPRLPVTMAVDPTDSDIVYAVSHAGAVYKTDDGGREWDSLSEVASGLPDSATISYNAVTVSPFDPNVVYLLAGSDIIGFNLQPAGADPNDMFTVYRSIDGGINWENLNNGYLGELSGGIKDIAFDINKPSNLFLASDNGVFLSRDNGNTWDDVSSNLGFNQISGLSISSDSTTINAATLGGGIISGKITGSGVSWESKSNLFVPIHNIQINIHPEDPDIFFASAYPGGIFKTLDGGENWIECNFGLPSFYVQDPTRQGYYAIRLAPSKPEIMYLGIYGIGMYKSEDGGNTWIARNGDKQDLSRKRIFSLYIDPENSDRVLVSSVEGVFKTLDGGETWSSVNNGLDGTQIRVFSKAEKGVYGGSLGNEILLLNESWQYWSALSPFWNYGIRWTIWNDRPLYQYTSLVFNENDPNSVLIGTFPAGIYKSIDKGEHFVESNYGWTRDGVFSLVYHPENDQIIYAGTYNGINRSTNQGDYWEVWDHGWPNEQWVFSIDFDSDNPDIMYACSKNGENEGEGSDGFHGVVMKSVDGGENWFEIMEGLSYENEFYKIIVDKFNSNILYVASQKDGIFISRNAGDSWEPWSQGLNGAIPGTNGNNVTNTMALSNDGTLIFLGTFGEGIFRRITATVAEQWSDE